MKFNLYNSTVTGKPSRKVLKQIEAASLDAAVDALFADDPNVSFDCISDHVCVVDGDNVTFWVCEQGYRPHAD
ncbi:MAG: hypothetical protein AB7Q00_14720 [Phycisphaerales bacterium]